MAIVEIPVRSDLPAYQFGIDLDGVNFKFSFRFNTRMGRWLWDILDTEENPILMGVPLLVNLDLIGRYKIEELPLGSFICINETGTSNNPGRYDLGNNVKLLYEEAL